MTDIYNSKKGILFQALNISALIGQSLLHRVNIIVQHMLLVCFCSHVFSLYLVEIAVKPDAKAAIASSYSQLTGGASYEHLVKGGLSTFGF